MIGYKKKIGYSRHPFAILICKVCVAWSFLNIILPPWPSFILLSFYLHLRIIPHPQHQIPPNFVLHKMLSGTLYSIASKLHLCILQYNFDVFLKCLSFCSSEFSQSTAVSKQGSILVTVKIRCITPSMNVNGQLLRLIFTSRIRPSLNLSRQEAWIKVVPSDQLITQNVLPTMKRKFETYNVFMRC